DLRRRTTAIHVEYVRADFLRHPGGHCHALRLTTKDLHRKRPLIFVEAHLPFRLRIVARQTLNRNELRNRQTNTATPFQQTPKRHVRHTRHRRKNQRRIDLDVTNFERLDFRHYGLMVTGVPTVTASYNSLMSLSSSATQPHVQSLAAP